MASENKKRKLKNSRFVKTALKNKSSEMKIKRGLFYTSSDRQQNKHNGKESKE